MTQRQEFIERFVVGYLAAEFHDAASTGFSKDTVFEAVQSAVYAWDTYVSCVSRSDRAEVGLVPLEEQCPRVPGAPETTEEEKTK